MIYMYLRQRLEGLRSSHGRAPGCQSAARQASIRRQWTRPGASASHWVVLHQQVLDPAASTQRAGQLTTHIDTSTSHWHKKRDVITTSGIPYWIQQTKWACYSMTICFAADCNHQSLRDACIKFYTFPVSDKEFEAWEKACRYFYYWCWQCRINPTPTRNGGPF